MTGVQQRLRLRHRQRHREDFHLGQRQLELLNHVLQHANAVVFNRRPPPPQPEERTSVDQGEDGTYLPLHASSGCAWLVFPSAFNAIFGPMTVAAPSAKRHRSRSAACRRRTGSTTQPLRRGISARPCLTALATICPRGRGNSLTFPSVLPACRVFWPRLPSSPALELNLPAPMCATASPSSRRYFGVHPTPFARKLGLAAFRVMMTACKTSRYKTGPI